MKKVLSVLLMVMLLFTASVAVFGCTDKTVTIVRYYADDLKFKEGEVYQDSSLKITAVLSDKTEKLVPVDNKDYTKIVLDDDMKALLDADNKFKDISETKTAYITVTFLNEVGAEGYTVKVKVTVIPKG